MGPVHADIELLNIADVTRAADGTISKQNIRKITVNMMVDSGSLMLAINERIKIQLGLVGREKQLFTLADGNTLELEIVGGIEVRFKNRWCTTDAVVLKGDTEPLFGAIPMEAMDVVIMPATRTLDVNPKYPYRPQHSLKGFK
jgi:hypothetical protein